MTKNQDVVPFEDAKDLITDTKAFSLYRLEGGVLFFDYRDNIVVEIDDVKLAFDLYVEHSNNYSMKVLLAFGEFSSITVEARKHAENKSMPTPAQAVVVRNLSQRMLARFYHLLRKDKHPLKFVKNVEEGLSWLDSVRHGGSQLDEDKELFH
ncbi:MAG: hypothetical protein AB8B56_00940 [Crocinitomicaceae bacterium]